MFFEAWIRSRQTQQWPRGHCRRVCKPWGESNYSCSPPPPPLQKAECSFFVEDAKTLVHHYAPAQSQAPGSRKRRSTTMLGAAMSHTLLLHPTSSRPALLWSSGHQNQHPLHLTRGHPLIHTTPYTDPSKCKVPKTTAACLKTPGHGSSVLFFHTPLFRKLFHSR